MQISIRDWPTDGWRDECLTGRWELHVEIRQHLSRNLLRGRGQAPQQNPSSPVSPVRRRHLGHSQCTDWRGLNDCSTGCGDHSDSRYISLDFPRVAAELALKFTGDLGGPPLLLQEVGFHLAIRCEGTLEETHQQ